MFNSINPALIIIDCQLAIDHFDSSKRSNSDAESKIAEHLATWREKERPIIHIRHSSKDETSPYHKSKPTFEFKDEVKPIAGETVVTKSENCAFVGTDLDEILTSMNCQELVICGVLTHHSVDATIRYAAAIGYKVIVPSSCTASFAITLSNGQVIPSETVQAIYLENLNGEYCEVVDSVAMQ